MSTEYYERTRRNRYTPSAEEDLSENQPAFRFGSLLFKQTIAALLLTLCIYGAKVSTVPFFNNCADALGRAIRYETDFAGLKEQLLDYFPNPFTKPVPEVPNTPENNSSNLPQ